VTATRILTVVGARPQFIKAAVVSRLIRGRSDVSEILVHTGQHYDNNMSSVFFEELAVPKPDFHLGIGSGNHGDQTGRMLAALEGVLLEVKPDWTLVYGDTNSTLAGALAAAKLQIPIAHVEAGLRSFNRSMPEEINRVLTDHLSTALFAPTAAAIANLEREGIARNALSLVGDVMYDAVKFHGAQAESASRVLADNVLERNRFILATIHRAENTDRKENLGAVVGGLALMSRIHPVIFPVHPRTRKALEEFGLLDGLPAGLKLIPPVGYLDMTMLEKNAALIVTDSGGVQKEAFFHRVPCLTLRHETEWVESVELGWNRLSPPSDADAIAAAARQCIGSRGREASPYGDGNAGTRILDAIRAMADLKSRVALA
jgi:UDP-GlcNAc3NAcA epimerase